MTAIKLVKDRETQAEMADAVHPFPWTCHVMTPDRAHVTDNNGDVVIAFIHPAAGACVVVEANAAATRSEILS